MVQCSKQVVTFALLGSYVKPNALNCDRLVRWPWFMGHEGTARLAQSPLYDLEVALHLPVCDVLAKFTLLPFAGGRIVVHKDIAEPLTRHLRRF